MTKSKMADIRFCCQAMYQIRNFFHNVCLRQRLYFICTTAINKVHDVITIEIQALFVVSKVNYLDKNAQLFY